MIEDEPDKYSYTVGYQYFIVIYWTKIVGFESEVESFHSNNLLSISLLK